MYLHWGYIYSHGEHIYLLWKYIQLHWKINIFTIESMSVDIREYMEYTYIGEYKEGRGRLVTTRLPTGNGEIKNPMKK